MTHDEDIDLLRLEAETATTPTRRAWARRLVDRIEHLESIRDAIAASMTYAPVTRGN